MSNTSYYRQRLAELEESIRIDEYNRRWKYEIDLAKEIIPQCRDDYTRSALWRSLELAKSDGLLMNEACRRTFGPHADWQSLCANPMNRLY